MRTTSELSPLRRESTAIALLFIGVAVSGCGGGSGGGDSSTASSEQVALAAGSAAGVTRLAIEAASTTAESSDGTDPTALSAPRTNAPGAVTRSVEVTDCTSLANGSGAIQIYDDEDTNLDLPNAAFPAPFSGTLPSLTPEHTQIRANCVADDLRLVGSMDISAASFGTFGQDGEVAVVRAGGYQGPAVDDPPDTEELFVLQVATGGIAADTRLRGVLHFCDGCVDADLGDFAGTPGLDSAAAAWLEMELSLPDLPTTVYNLGNSETDRFTLVSSEVAASTAAVDISGRLAVDSEEDDCDFDVTYETLDSIVVEDFDGDASMTTGGALNVTDNDSGETFLVEYDSDGNVNVDGERVDVDELEQVCNA